MTNLERLANELALHLQQQNWYLVTAESCTGGWIATIVTAIAGSSSWFERGFITYSNAAKQDMLGVSADILAKYGAVSEATVLAMVNGAIEHSHAQVAIAVSGIAGPSGGTPDKPVGTVWIGYTLPHKTWAHCHHFTGDRRSIREQAVEQAFTGLLREVTPH